MAAALVTDSASALTVSACAALGIGLVQMRVLGDGEDRPDSGAEDAWLYSQLAAGTRVTTSQPAPAELLAVYRATHQEGADAAWSLHLSGALSGTINAATVAARSAPIPVQVVDTGTASMPQGLCVLAALVALREDPRADIAAVVAAEVAAQENVFVSLDAAVLRRSGRADGHFDHPLPVLSLRNRRPVEVVGKATDMHHAIELMAARVGDSAATVAIGSGGAGRWADALAAAIASTTAGNPALRYRVPPSLGAHAGPTVGVVVSSLRLPADVRAAVAAPYPACDLE